MAAVIGQRVTQEQSADAPRLPPSTKTQAAFYYAHHPHRWQFVAESGEWLPLLTKIKIDPGVGGISESGGTDLAVAQATRRGWHVIRPADERLGDHRWYVQRIPKAGKGFVHCDATESVETIGGRAFWEEGGEAYLGFLRHIVEAGIVPAMSPQIVKLKTSQQAAVVERLESSVAASPHNQVLTARLDKARAVLAGMTGQPKRKKASRATT